MKILLSLLALLILLYGCIPEQKKQGFWECGYSVTKIEENIYKITLRQDIPPGTGRVEDFALSLCAQVTIENGYKYFTFLDERSCVIRCFKEKPENIQTPIYEAEQRPAIPDESLR